MRNTRGTNQFKAKKRMKPGTGLALIGIAWILLSSSYLYFNDTKITSPLPVQATSTVYEVSPTKIPEPAVLETTPAERVQEIESYIRVIFGRDAKVAIAVSRNECGPTNKAYPGCVYHTDAEYSVGIFQINLYNKNHWIHAKKVPGETMEEKAEWLKNPYNNTLIAYKIFTDSGFTPWSAFTSGRYLKDM